MLPSDKAGSSVDAGKPASRSAVRVEKNGRSIAAIERSMAARLGRAPPGMIWGPFMPS